ncbi:SAVED domain-containing protein [Deinococcus marmoris]|uniref:SAVED domain-containing protein n=1 Tax=Deinococcus marmoris TaxID=249408 RepID=UPI000497A773|nr:SAVED domain-containing protein [Deinococcus marmoris]
MAELGFEVEGASGFDDIMLRYDPPIPDGRGGQTHVDYEQVKYRVTHKGQVGFADLTDPAFIGATSESLLQKLHRVQQQHAPNGQGSRFILRQPYPIDPQDPLAGLVSRREGAIRLEVLFDGTGDRSAMGQVRKQWREHLVVDDAGLRQALTPLRLKGEIHDLEEVQARLNSALDAAGFHPVPRGQLHNPYEQLPWKLFATQGEVKLDSAGLTQLMRDQNLYVGPPRTQARVRRLGVRSYAWNSDYIVADLEAHLCCLSHFDDRVIRAPELWKTHVQPEIAAFVHQNFKSGDHVHLSLEAHYSVVFAAGRATARSSARVWPEQFGEVWQVGAQPVAPFEQLWNFDEVPIGAGEDIVVSVSVAQDLKTDVRQAVVSMNLPASILLEATVLPSVGRQAVQGADHAYLLAQKLTHRLQQLCAQLGRGRRIHLFVAVPKALMFFLGQESRTLGNIQLYEFDGAYTPSILID